MIDNNIIKHHQMIDNIIKHHQMIENIIKHHEKPIVEALVQWSNGLQSDPTYPTISGTRHMTWYPNLQGSRGSSEWNATYD